MQGLRRKLSTLVLLMHGSWAFVPCSMVLTLLPGLARGLLHGRGELEEGLGVMAKLLEVESCSTCMAQQARAGKVALIVERLPSSGKRRQAGSPGWWRSWQR